MTALPPADAHPSPTSEMVWMLDPPAHSPPTLWLKSFFRLVLATGFLWFLLAHLGGWDRLRALWGNFGTPQSLIALGITPLILALRALRWNAVLRDIGEPFALRELASVYGTSLFLGMMTPGKIGEGSRIWFARDRVRGSLATAAFSVAYDKILDVAPTLLVAVLFLGLAFGSMNGTSVSTQVALALLAIAAAVIAVRPQFLQRLFNRRWVRRREDQSSRQTDLPLLSQRATASTLAFSVCVHGLAILQSVLFAGSVGIVLPTGVLYGAICVGAVAAALPVSIGGLGSREVALVGALSLQAVPHTAALDFSLFHLANSLVTAGIAAPFFFAYRWRR